MCGVHIKDRKIFMDFMSMLGLNETRDQLVKSNSVHWYGHVFRRALDLDAEGQRKKGKLKRTWKNQVEEESMMARFPIKVACWRKSDRCWVEVNLATLTCWAKYLNLNIVISLTEIHMRMYMSNYIFHLTNKKMLYA